MNVDLAKHKPKAIAVTAPPEPFEDAVQRAVAQMQLACAAVLDALPALPSNGQKLAEFLDVDRNLAWKLTRLVSERDQLSAGRFVLGPQALRIFLRAVEKQDVPVHLLNAVRDASATFEEVVQTYAGDRATIEMMLSGTGSTPDESIELALRRSAFRSNSYFAGVQARTQFQTFFLIPSADGQSLDGASIRGLIDLRRIRAGAPAVIGRSACTYDEGTFVLPKGIEPIDESTAPGQIALIRDFCSKPLPSFRRVMGERGFVEDVLEDGPIGRTGAITVTAGEILRAMTPLRRSPENERLDLVARVRTPCENAVVDLLLPRHIYGTTPPQFDVYCDMLGDSMHRVEERHRYRRAVQESVEPLGSGLNAMRSPSVPGYTQLLRYAFDRLNLDPANLEAFRVQMEYPFVPASLKLTVLTPE